MAFAAPRQAAAPTPAPATPQQPVLIILYSRFYDHSHQHTTDERIQRLLPLISRLHEKYPQFGISALLQFSGTVSQVLDEENSGLHLVDRIKDFEKRGLVDVGYTGEEEPSYLYRPKPNLLAADTPEARWAAKAEAAERFLTDYKNPVTGLPVAGLSGGAKRTLEVFGNLTFLSGLTTTVGGDSPTAYEARKLSPTAMLSGIPGRDPRRGIEGQVFSAANFSKFLSPDPEDSPEVFWQDNTVRISDMSLSDLQPHSTDEDLESLKKVFAKLDRSHVRVMKLEVAAYKRYLTRRADGSVVADPMEWLYYHPDDPVMPLTLKAMVTQGDVEAGYKKDEATLNWLLEQFLPANPGSRFISVSELAKMTAPADAEVDAAQLSELAANLEQHFVKMPMSVPNYGRAGSRFFTLAESFELFAQALAAESKAGSIPKTVGIAPMYGPYTLPNDMGASTGSISVSEVIKTASEIAPKLANTAWKPVPDNAVPAILQVGSLHLNAGQFLRLMEQAYSDPSPERTLHVNGIALASQAAFMYPKNTPMIDQSSGWTVKPAPLRLAAAPSVATGAQ